MIKCYATVNEYFSRLICLLLLDLYSYLLNRWRQSIHVYTYKYIQIHMFIVFVGGMKTIL